MEAKFLASVFSFLSIFLAIYAQSLAKINADDDDSTEFEFETAIYYGDSNVNLGAPFSITCIIPITDPIYWIKDDEPITRHNLRHGRDEHSFILTESAIEGEKHKIEAHLKVRHALKVHEGKYQCNTLHSSYHMLHVRSPINANDNQLSTETIVYETIHDLTPSSSAENIFTLKGETWEPAVPVSLPPTRTTQQHRKHHSHHHHSTGQQQQQQSNHFQDQQQQHKFIYINATNFDGLPRLSGGSAISGISVGESNESGGLINVEYLPPTQYNELTTVPWGSTAAKAGGESGGSGMVGRTKKPPPQFPPPRTTWLTSPLPPPSASVSSLPLPQNPDEFHHSVTPIIAPNSNNVYRQQQQHQQQQYANFPLQTIQPSYQTPMLTTYQQLLQPTRQATQQYSQTAVYPPHQQQQGGYTYAPFMPPILTTSNTGTTMSITHPPTSQQQEQEVNRPISKEPDFLVPNYDNSTKKLKIFEIRSPLVLSCNITKEGDFKLTWEKNGTDVSKVKALEGRYKIIDAERKFIIEKTDIHDDGLYSCVADNQKAHINVIARVVVRVPSNTGVVEGEKLTIVCTVVGTDPQLSWMIANNHTIYNSTDRFILKPDDNKIENAILQVENISLDDRGEYKCIGRNLANTYGTYSEASDVSYVRVKGKLAALWPFLGICAEVLILCTIILIYEKRRNITELDESDTDPQEQKKKRRSYD